MWLGFRQCAQTEATSKHFESKNWRSDQSSGEKNLFTSKSNQIISIITQQSMLLGRITTRYLSFHPMAQCVVHALRGLRMLLRLAHLARARRSRNLRHARGCARPSHARFGNKNITYFSMGPKFRYPTVPNAEPRRIFALS